MQVVVGVVRPHKSAPVRSAWNLFHHNWGRLALLLGWVAIWLGVAMLYQDQGDMSLPAWVAPLAGELPSRPWPGHCQFWVPSRQQSWVPSGGQGGVGGCLSQVQSLHRGLALWNSSTACSSAQLGNHRTAEDAATVLALEIFPEASTFRSLFQDGGTIHTGTASARSLAGSARSLAGKTTIAVLCQSGMSHSKQATLMRVSLWESADTVG